MKLTRYQSPAGRLKPLPSRIARIPSSAGAIADRAVYDSGRWRNHVRPAKLARDPLCQACSVAGITVAATTVDHRQAMSKGGDPWSDDNLVSLCDPCHALKTAAEQAGRALPAVVPSSPRSPLIR